jgi:glycosyltransferase involved in cell wall biosynthesis
MIASWHTNLHEFAARRVQKLLSIISPKVRTKAGQAVEGAVLDRLVWFFGKSDVLLAPSPGLVELLRRRTSKLTLPMGRGVDVNLFSPDHRDRRNGPFTIGYVGRLMPEKNVRFLAKLERALEQAGRVDFQFVVTGSGSERQWLEANLKRGRFTGALHGEDLARTYANMDVFVFPSHTDTFGQVVQEAQASGVPPVVTASGGPQFLVVHGVTGLVARDEAAFVQHVLHLMDNPEQRRAMGVEARRQCYLKCWERIFVELYKAYEVCVLMGSSSRLLPPPERATARAPAG